MLHIFAGEAAGRVAAAGGLNDGLVLSTDGVMKSKGPGAVTANGPAAAGLSLFPSDPGAVSPGYHHLGHAMSDPAAVASLENRNGRRLLGQGLMFQGTTPGGVGIMQPQQQPPVLTPASALNQGMPAPPGRPIVKG